MRIKGFIFAAGLGTRLKPFTGSRPKALVRLDGKLLIDNAIEKMKDSGIDEIIVNVHHLPDMIIDHLKSEWRGADITVSDERAYLRDTAGGLKFAAPFWSDCDALLLYNVDIVSDIDIVQLIDYHRLNNSDATLAVRHRETSRYLVFDRLTRRLCGWTNIKTGERIDVVATSEGENMAFSGIHLINSELADSIPSVEKSSIINYYLCQAKSRKIMAFDHDNGRWDDVGKFDIFRDRLS